jgi:hypothetical protein
MNLLDFAGDPRSWKGEVTSTLKRYSPKGTAGGQVHAFQWRGPKQFGSFANVADPLTHVVVAFAPGTRATGYVTPP